MKLNTSHLKLVRLILTIFFLLSYTSLSRISANELSRTQLSMTPKLHYNFDGVSGTTVPDQSESGYDAKLVNGAKVSQMGKYNVLDLGTGSGYLNMQSAAGSIIKNLENYTVSTYYRVDKEASLSGAGFFLWSFSKIAANTSTSDPYITYRLNAQRFAISTGGYSNERGIEVGTESEKNIWKHVLYRQTGTKGELYIDGILTGTATVPLPKNLFSSNTPYNWIGRAPFNGDNYLQNTLVYGFQLFDEAINDDDISSLASLTVDLEKEYKYGTVGDFTKLSESIKSGKEFLSSIDNSQFPINAIAEFQDALEYAQEITDQKKFSQFLIDEQIELLSNALANLKATKGFEFESVAVTKFYNTDKGFKHPGALHTEEDFERVRKLISEKDPVILAAYERLKSNQYSQSDVATWPTETIVRGGGVGENYMNAARGGAMAYQNALRWKLSGDKAHADRAVTILNSWADVCKNIGGDTNASLASGIYGYAFANAAELMRDYEGWDSDDFKKFQNWMLDVWYPRCIGFLRGRHNTWLNTGNTGGMRPGHYWSNWGLCNVVAVMSIGILCDDVFIYNQGVSYYKHDQVGSYKDNPGSPIYNDGLNEFLGNLVPDIHDDERGPFGKLGQMQESGRDQGHSLMALGLAADICQIGWNQGDDLFSYMDNRLAAGAEHVAAYNHGGLEVEELPWTEYWYRDCRTAIHNSWKMTGMNSTGRGGHRPFWDRLIGHYEGIKGVKMRYSRAGQSALGADGGGGNYGTTSGGFDHLGFTTLMNYRPKMASMDEVPTQIIPYITYKGTKYQQSELGGIKNTYEHVPSSAIPMGSIIKFSPELPEGVNDTGNWLWSTGETTKDIEKTFNESRVITVTYTNDKGVKSTKMFSIAVAGDCRYENLTPNVWFDDISRDDTILTIPRGSAFILTAWNKSGWGYYKWDNGSTDYRITVNNLRKDRSYSVIYTNQGGKESKLTFHVKVVDILPSVSINQSDIEFTNKAIVARNKSVTLMPLISSEIRGGTWEWSTGETTQNITIDKVTETGIYTVKYTFEGVVYTQVFNVYMTIINKEMADGNYIIKDINNNTFLTNDGSDTPKFMERIEENNKQTWNIQKDGSRYKITSLSDMRFLTANGLLGEPADYSRLYATYIFYGVSEGDFYSIKNGGIPGSNYWGINDNATINTNATTSLVGYPFEIITEEILLGIGDVDYEYENKITIYPGMIYDIMNIRISETLLSGAKAFLYSSSGSLLRIIDCKPGITGIDVSNLPSGLYFVTVGTNDSAHSFRVIKR